MSTYPLRKLILDATMASVCFLLPPESQIIYLGEKKILLLHCLCVRCVRLSCNVIPPHQVPLSPLSDPMLSCLLFFFFFLVFRVGLAMVKTVFLPYF